MESPYRLGVLLLISFIILIITVVSVQAATLNVTVTDARTDNRLNNVSITVTHEDGAVTQGVSSATGALEILDLATGVYTITASSPGYTKAVMTDVALADDKTKLLEIALSSEVIQLEKVSVTASRRREKVLKAPASVALIGDSEISFQGIIFVETIGKKDAQKKILKAKEDSYLIPTKPAANFASIIVQAMIRPQFLPAVSRKPLALN